MPVVPGAAIPQAESHPPPAPAQLCLLATPCICSIPYSTTPHFPLSPILTHLVCEAEVSAGGENGRRGDAQFRHCMWTRRDSWLFSATFLLVQMCFSPCLMGGVGGLQFHCAFLVVKLLPFVCEGGAEANSCGDFSFYTTSVSKLFFSLLCWGTAVGAHCPPPPASMCVCY